MFSGGGNGGAVEISGVVEEGKRLMKKSMTGMHRKNKPIIRVRIRNLRAAMIFDSSFEGFVAAV